MGVETILLGGALAASAAGTGVSIMGSIAEGRNAATSAAYQSAVARNQAAIAKANAQAAELDVIRADEETGRISESGQRALEAQGRSARGQMGELATDQSASGLTGGSHAAQRRSLQVLASEDRLNTRAGVDSEIAGGIQAAMEARAKVVDYTNEATGAKSDSLAYDAQGKFAKKLGRSRAIGAGISGLGSLLSIGTSPMAQNWLAKRGSRPTDRNGYGPGGR